MIWLTWRQFRVQGLVAVAVVAAAAIVLLVTGLQLHHTYGVDLTSCTPLHSCGDVLARLRQSYSSALTFTQLFVVAVPALIGMFWGAPLVGHELEAGTDQLVWNQSVTRTQWLAVKFAGVGVASIAAAAIVSLLLTWWAGPLDLAGNRFGPITFSSRDVVPLAYAAFAFALGTFAGLLLRRTVPAMALTLAVFIGMQIFVTTLVRPDLMPSTTITFAVNKSTANRFTGVYQGTPGGSFYFVPPLPQSSWVMSTPPVEDSSGRVALSTDYSNCLSPSGPSGGLSIAQIAECLDTDDLHESVVYQPASHYWPLQWYESGVYVALAAALSAGCFWRIRRRKN